MGKIEILSIEKGATPDPMNVNKHTQRGRGLHENSMRKRGAGRSIFSAGKGVDVPVVMGGNQTLEIAATLGMEVNNVHTTGDQIVNVVRDDIVPGSADFYAMGIEDNEVGKLSYNPDIDILAAVMADPAMQALKMEDRMLADIVEGMGLGEDDNTYSRKVETPIYQIRGDKPAISELHNQERYIKLLTEIDASNLLDEQKEFLRIAATRHIVFDFSKIAEYYAHADKDLQGIMENSALVIIDFNKAIELGYVKMSELLKKQIKAEYPNE